MVDDPEREMTLYEQLQQACKCAPALQPSHFCCSGGSVGSRFFCKGVANFFLLKGVAIVFYSEAQKPGPCRLGALVLWSLGPLVFWSSGPSVLWSLGPLIPWSSGPSVLWSLGPLVRWSSGPLVLWSLGPLVRWSSGPLVLLSLGPLVLWPLGASHREVVLTFPGCI